MAEAIAPPPAERLTPAPTLTAPEVAARAAVPLDVAKRVWRALGMPETEDNQVVFGDRDAEALASLRGILELGLPLHEILVMARLYGQALSRIADAETRLFQERIVVPAMAEDGAEVEERLRPVVEALLDASGRVLDQIHRRKLMMALDALRAGGDSESMAAGFADLVEFSAISDALPAEDLGGLVEAFEDLAVQACTDAGARLVKVIGDGVMFVASEPARALEAAAAVVAGASEHPTLPEARAGLDFGDAVPLGGDYFGRPVNVAARITAFAKPATVVVSGEFVEALDDEDLPVSKIGGRRLKGVGRVTLYKVRRDGEAASRKGRHLVEEVIAVATQKQRQAAKRNVKKAQGAAKQKRTIANLPGSVRRDLGRQAAKSRQRGGSPGRRLEDRTRQDLYAVAKRKGIRGRSRMGKWDLIQAIRRAG